MNRDDFDHLLFLPLDLENPPLDCIDYLNSLDFSELYPDRYRNCYHVPIRFDKKRREFEWMQWAKEMPTLVQWLGDVLFPYTGDTRVMIITTPNDYKNPLHIDCSRHEFTKPQHKLRYVLQGNTDDLKFVGEMPHGIEMSSKPKNVDKPFIMSGKWPHEMHNTSGDTKFTLAIGAPWDSDWDNYRYRGLLQKSWIRFSEYYLSSLYASLPYNWESLFEESRDHRQDVELLEKQVGR